MRNRRGGTVRELESPLPLQGAGPAVLTMAHAVLKFALKPYGMMEYRTQMLCQLWNRGFRGHGHNSSSPHRASSIHIWAAWASS